MKMLGLLVAMAFAVSTLFTAQTFAGDMYSSGKMHGAAKMHSFYKADEIIGKNVLSKDGETLGEVENLIIGRNGDVKFLLISSGGVFDIGEKVVAVPWSTVQTPVTDTLMLSLGSSTVRNAPAFAEGEFTADLEREVNAYYEEEGAKSGSTEFEHQGEFEGKSKYEHKSKMMHEKGAMSKEFHGAFRGSELLDKPVLTKEGERVGQLQNIIIGANGEAKYALIASGGFLGFGSELIAVPWSMIAPSTEEDALTLSASAEKLRNAPSFDEQSYGPEWEREIHTYYGTDEGMEYKSRDFEKTGKMEKGRFGEDAGMKGSASFEGAEYGIFKSGDLMKKTVLDQQGREVGTVHDFVISKDGKIKYLILSFADERGEFVAVPWQVVKVGPEKDMLSLNVTHQKLMNAPRFVEADWQNLDDPAWNRRIHSYYGLDAEGKNFMHKDKMHEGMKDKGMMYNKGKMDDRKSGY
ncbi:MAG: PRC-barrel domain containing protein [Candidatus Abyssobacteria bacterium SURF_5]|uniref:PRC-barrel domain containing protein n=1 Tax=Abyssobacteria bacterium (strain SURF_5) TaxID=2093360 RepID=A0A3A4NEM3_ABYX5|nr:MAG: PRC-barrel domain containing protein [Candidatus Abyssubacteria bacterium SURF_5]